MKIKRLYIMPEVWETVTQSQVFNWVKLVNDEGVLTDCLSITKKKLDKESVNKIEKLIGGSFIQIKNFKTLIVNDIYLSFVLVKYYMKNIEYDKIIFQTRKSDIGLTYLFLKFLSKSKFIFEARAANNEEIKHVNCNKKRTLKLRIKNYFSELSEKLVSTKSDMIFCVSNTLKDYYIEKYELPKGRFNVFPGAADAELFFLDEKNRNETRASLNIKKDDFLVVYSGKLDKKWEIPGSIMSFFKQLKERDSRFKMLLLTPDIRIAEDLIDQFRFQDIVKVKKLNLEEVNAFLNASDIGLLLREDILMNNVASPTKFAEYLLAGLPVIISKGIYDFAKDINNTGFGVVVDSPDEISEIEICTLLKAIKSDKKEIAKYGLESYSKEAFIKAYVKILRSI